MPGPAGFVPAPFIPVDPGSSSNVGSVTPAGAMLCENPATQLFNDTFNLATLDTVIRWNSAASGTATAPSAPGTNGSTTLTGGTTANSYSYLVSKPTFYPTEPGFLVSVHRINLQTSIPTPAANYLGWGLFNLPTGGPTFAAPIQDGAVFEIVSGQLYASTYGAGTRLVIAALGNKLPTDGNAHKYYVRFRGDICYWSIDTEYNVVASYLTGASGPVNNQLSTGLIVVSNTGAAAATIVDNGSNVSDTGRSGYAIGDGLYPFRKASVNSNSMNVAPAVNYSVISTAGTTAVASGGGVYYGVNVVSTGTSWTVTPYDIVVSGTTTNTLAATATATAAGLLGAPGATGVGVRFLGQLALVTTGTPGQFNALWD
jgi:hypothetical protein